MRDAPSVIHPVGRSLFFGLMLAALAAAALGVIAAWGLIPVEASRARPAMGLALAVWTAWCAWAAVAWWRSPRGRLEWRGGVAGGASGGWFWHGAADAPARGLRRHPELRLDLQRVLLVRADGRWLWLEARQGGESHWWALRRALLAAADSV